MVKKQETRKFLVTFDIKIKGKKIHFEEIIESTSKGKAKWVFAKKYKVPYLDVRIRLA